MMPFLLQRPCHVKNQLIDFFDLKIVKNACREKITKNILFTLFPNPNKGSFSIKINSENVATIIDIGIYDLKGQNIYNEKLYLSETNTFQIQDLKLLNGVYIVRIFSREKYFGMQKLIIEN